MGWATNDAQPTVAAHAAWVSDAYAAPPEWKPPPIRPPQPRTRRTFPVKALDAGADIEALTHSANVRNGTRPKTVLTEATGQVQIEVSRDREGTFEPQIVKKRQRRLTGGNEIVLSLYVQGPTTAAWPDAQTY
jgi:hypothetical protein